MGIFDKFLPGTNAAPPASPAPIVPGVVGQPGNIPPPVVPAIPDQGIVPVAPVAPVAEPKEPDSRLAPFEKLWEDIPVDPNSPISPEIPELKAEDVAKIMENANFTPNITDEQKAAIAAGGEGAQAAFEVAMADVARQVMVQATMVGNKLTERQVKAAIEKHMAGMPGMLRDQVSADHLKSSNPIFSNPAVKPVIEATRQQLLQKFPDATPAEITTMAQDFILAMGESLTPIDTTAPGEEDWSKFLTQ